MPTLSLTQLLSRAESLSSSLQSEAARLANTSVDIIPLPNKSKDKEEEIPGEEPPKQSTEEGAAKLKQKADKGKQSAIEGVPLTSISLDTLIQRGMVLGETYDIASLFT